MLDIISIPFGYLIRFCYEFTQNYALALLLFTLVFKLLLSPLSIKQHMSTRKQAALKPKEKAIKKRYEGRTDQQARIDMANDLMKLRRDENFKMFGGCLPLLIQLPIIMSLYRIITMPLKYISILADDTINSIRLKMYQLFSNGSISLAEGSELRNLFTSAESVEAFNPSQIQMISVMKNNTAAFSEFGDVLLPDFTFLNGMIDLSAKPTFASGILILIPILTALVSFLSVFVMKRFQPQPDINNPEEASVATTMKTMNIFMPLMSAFIAFRVPAVIGLYWIYQSIFGALIQIFLYIKYPMPTFTDEEVAAIEYEMNKDYIPPEIKKPSRRNYDEDDPEYELEYEDKTDKDGTEREEYRVPPRRRVDKDGNPIRSLHYIDEDDEIQVNEEKKDDDE